MLPEMLGHGEQQQRKREHDPHPEPPRHVEELGIDRLGAGRRHRLQGHAADRAGAGLLADDLRVHRAGPQHLAPRWLGQRAGRRTLDRGPLRRGGWRLASAQVLRRIRRELVPASPAAEEIRPTGVLDAMLGGRGIDGHAADRVADPAGRCRPGAGMAVSARGMIVAVTVEVGRGHGNSFRRLQCVAAPRSSRIGHSGL